ncbi:hypothetical protein PHYPSEUDO_012072 [Phytophthora pseudosyringae]|uniref:Uncharacterized protein n=1 Tax=Phytophthora pseudosyringae TaxID=221518 RepID=A0A8T1VA65_9STRA|nr:hypothetical protein PHYPSEUDO_012072 [Phytophthora pseudosyringae]
MPSLPPASSPTQVTTEPGAPTRINAPPVETSSEPSTPARFVPTPPLADLDMSIGQSPATSGCPAQCNADEFSSGIFVDPASPRAPSSTAEVTVVDGDPAHSLPAALSPGRSISRIRVRKAARMLRTATRKVKRVGPVSRVDLAETRKKKRKAGAPATSPAPPSHSSAGCPVLPSATDQSLAALVMPPPSAAARQRPSDATNTPGDASVAPPQVAPPVSLVADLPANAPVCAEFVAGTPCPLLFSSGR